MACGDVVLLQHAARKYGDAIAERHRLDLIVSDMDGRDAEPGMEPAEFGAHLHAQLGVEIG